MITFHCSLFFSLGVGNLWISNLRNGTVYISTHYIFVWVWINISYQSFHVWSMPSKIFFLHFMSHFPPRFLPCSRKIEDLLIVEIVFKIGHWSYMRFYFFVFKILNYFLYFLKILVFTLNQLTNKKIKWKKRPIWIFFLMLRVHGGGGEKSSLLFINFNALFLVKSNYIA